MQQGSPIEKSFRLKPTQKKALDKLNIKIAKDLLYHLPSRYGEKADIKAIKEVSIGEKVFIHGKVLKIKKSKAFRKKMPLTEATIEDETGKIKAVWFHQPYIAKMLQENSWSCFIGKVTEGKNGIYLANPEIRKDAVVDPAQLNSYSGKLAQGLFKTTEEEQELIPLYPESRGISSRWMHHSILKLLQSGAHQELSDPIPEPVLKKYKLPSLEKALVFIHTPKREKDALAARKRFAFEEIFFIQLAHLKSRANRNKNNSLTISVNKKDIAEFIEQFPFKPTKAQLAAIGQILADLEKGKPMTRLLEGDVGSGKTFVAAVVSYAIIKSGFQVAYMAPTEILARQIFDSFIKYFSAGGVEIGLMTSSECRKYPAKTLSSQQTGNGSTHISKTQLLRWVQSGEVAILVGTHSLIQEKTKFSARDKQVKKGKDLALVIIDEQHRFGTKQRAKLAKKKSETTPHLLSMTATPIPRTLALTIYSDLDLTLLDEMPSGRKKIITEIVKKEERGKAYEKMREELRQGRQAYVICPRIEEPDPDKASSLRVKSVKAEAERLKKEIFPEYEIEILHSKLKPTEKEEVMGDFLAGKVQILVATSVVEVGVNVENATLILIEGAERFGLAQLHQLRGRVIRSNHQAYCFVFTDSKSQNTKERLQALKTAKNGFELAEYDLALRGPGELSGMRQWGISDIGMEAIKNIKMVEAARDASQKIIAEDPELKNYPLIAKRLANKKTEVHFE